MMAYFISKEELKIIIDALFEKMQVLKGDTAHKQLFLDIDELYYDLLGELKKA